jgi:hypothetical protein
MHLSRRLGIVLLIVMILLLAGVLFGPFILNEILKPIALVAWILLRIFVLSINQHIYWILMILVALVILLRILSPVQPVPPVEESLGSNETINSIELWRNLFRLNDSTPRDERTLRHELTHMLASFYASKSHSETAFGYYEALQKGVIPLPEHITAFLFPEESQETGHPIKRLLQTIRKTPLKWIQRWTGQEKAEHYRMIDEVLNFMETSLEIKNDERKST